MLTSAILLRERLSGRGIRDPNDVMSKVQALEEKVILGHCLATEHVEKVTILLLFFTDCVKIQPILEKKKRPGNSFHILLDCGRIGTFYAIGIDRFPID